MIKIQAEVSVGHNPLSSQIKTSKVDLQVLEVVILQNETFFLCLEPITNKFHVIPTKDAIFLSCEN